MSKRYLIELSARRESRDVEFLDIVSSCEDERTAKKYISDAEFLVKMFYGRDPKDTKYEFKTYEDRRSCLHLQSPRDAFPYLDFKIIEIEDDKK